MNVKELIAELNKCDPDARVIVAGDHDANKFLTVKKVKTITDENDGIEDCEEWEKEETWNKGDVELEIWWG